MGEPTMNIKLTPVASSNISAIGFVENQVIDNGFLPKNVLRINFSSGAIYDYQGVTREIYEDFMASESKGSFFHKYINKRYSFRRVDNV